jgi:membrane-bound inhibitor of C-type lysozyme
MKIVTSKAFLVGVGILILVWAFFIKQEKQTYLFSCEGSSTIRATFYPKDDEKVSLRLSDGRVMALAHLVSASGARYGNKDESVVFWNKGDTAWLTEGSSTTYSNCTTPSDQSAVTSTVATTTTKSSSSSTGPSQKTATKSSFPRSYANSEYGFSMRFPATVTSQPYFTTFYDVASNWRINAALNNQGKVVVSFPVYRIDQGTVSSGKNYPLFYVAETRVGVSPNVQECYSMDPGYTSQKILNVSINGVTFKRFSFEDAGMMKMMKGESYRTVHNNMCYVIEQIRHQSTYKDDTMKPGLSEAALSGYYTTAGDIAKTFTFTR